MSKLTKITRLFRRLDTYKSNPDGARIAWQIELAIAEKRPIELLCFTCSTIQDQYLFDQQEPWKYVSLSPTGNNLEADLPELRNLVQQIAELYPARLTILIGNTDPYYIYSEGFEKYPKLGRNLLWQKFGRRWKRYQTTLTRWLKSGGLTNFRVMSWYDFEQDLQDKLGLSFEASFNTLLPKIGSYFEKSDFRYEKEKLRGAFGPGKYFPTLKVPKAATLDKWIMRKFTEYMLQGLFIYMFFPDAILLQNEKPSLLRRRMYQPLIQQVFGNVLPNLFPFGVDNAGYR